MYVCIMHDCNKKTYQHLKRAIIYANNNCCPIQAVTNSHQCQYTRLQTAISANTRGYKNHVCISLLNATLYISCREWVYISCREWVYISCREWVLHIM